jgi:UDP-glucuronate 4-epimerase
MQRLSQTTYLVTGAAGFIGSNLVETLLERGDRVVGVDNFDSYYDPALKWENIESARAHPNFILAEADIRNGDMMTALMREHNVTSVIHLAARAGVRPSIDNPLLYQSVNVEGTNVLLESMRAAGVKRLVFASSSSVYGDRETTPFRESDNVDMPISPYAATKKAGELICHTYYHLFDFDIACVRLFTVYGPRQRPEMAIHLFTRRIADGHEVPMYGDGSTARDYTYVGDAVQGILAVEENFSGYCLVNIGESNTIELRELICLIGDALHVAPRIRLLPLQGGDVRITCADIDVARSLGYDPVTPVHIGIKKFVDWFRTSSHVVVNAQR